MMMDKQQAIDRKLDERQLIFRTIDRITNIAAFGTKQPTKKANWYNVYANRIKAAVNTLEGLLQPILDEEYQETKEEVRQEKLERFGKYDDDREFDYENFAVSFAEKRFKLLIQELHEAGVYFAETGDFIIDTEKQENQEKEAIEIE